MSDDVGSTEHIIKRVTNAPAGSQWAIGTEIHLVNRLKNENPDRFVVPLDDCGCLCSTMFRIDAPHLLWVLENLVEGRVVNQISVPAGRRRGCARRPPAHAGNHQLILAMDLARQLSDSRPCAGRGLSLLHAADCATIGRPRLGSESARMATLRFTRRRTALFSQSFREELERGPAASAVDEVIEEAVRAGPLFIFRNTRLSMDDLKKLIREVPDFPKPGILFYDITTLLKDKIGFRTVIDRLTELVAPTQPDIVIGIEARGFIFAPALAYHLGAGFVPVRKAEEAAVGDREDQL